MPDGQTKTGKPWEGLSNEEMRQALARAESSAEQDDDGYLEHNRGPLNALGRYQLTTGALLEAKWKIGDTWTDKARAFGVASDADFKNNPSAQEAALADVMRDYERQTRRLQQHVGQTYQGIADGPLTISDAGLIAASHGQGAGATSAYLQRRINGRESDDPKTRKIDKIIEARMRSFSSIPYRRGQW